MTRRPVLPAVAVALAVFAAAPRLAAQSVAGPYAGAYSLASLGTPVGVPGPFGGLTFLAGDPNTLLLGGAANGAGGVIRQVGVVRDAATQRITGFSGPATPFATAPNIDGGLAYGPGGVLFYTAFPTHQIGQLRPGSTAPDRVTAVGSIVGSSVGGLGFVPDGFANAGQLAILGYNSNQWRRTVLTADGSGLYNFTSAPGAPVVQLSGGLEGVAWVPFGSALFGNPSILVSEYGAGQIATYQLDANGDPIVVSRQTFVTGLSGAEGAVIDPLTGDFLFSTFGGGSQVVRVSGFSAPPPQNVVPEPGTWVLVAAGLVGLGAAGRRRRAA